jgi:glutamine cyclotransferase
MHRISARISAFSLAILTAGIAACSDSVMPAIAPEFNNFTYSIVNEFPHDTGALTQGLIWVDSVLVEGTGFYDGESTLRRVRLETGVVIQSRVTPVPAFGEGVTQIGGRIIQLTWVKEMAFVYDAETFAEIDQFTYSTEGWGLTHDNNRLIMSDGTATIYFRNPSTFELLGTVKVHTETDSVSNLNELEFINGKIWANQFEEDFIFIIDPADGWVTGRIDLTGILPNPPNVLNGIAYDAASDRIFVTGKRWPSLFEITISKDTTGDITGDTN